MRIFEKAEVALVVDEKGEEVQVSVLGHSANGSYLVVRTNDAGYPAGIPFRVEDGKLLAPKGPFFDIRGQVLTASSSHSGETGEIIGTATCKSGKTFFNVAFHDGTSEWFSEDHVFIDDEVKRAYDKEKRGE